MATADELLASTYSTEDDTTLIIDNYRRTINIPKGVTNLGVEHDDEVLRLNFKMPRYLDDTDLSQFTIRINYMNANAETDVYYVDDKFVTTNYITFSWLVGPNATAYKGTTSFIVCMVDSTDDAADNGGLIDREFNTTIASLPVFEGLEVDNGIFYQYSDLITQWRSQLFGTGESALKRINVGTQKAMDTLTEHKNTLLATIPEDYQNTYESAEEGIRTKADAIVSTAEGTAITVNDSSDDYVRNLRIFGKTTQLTTTGKNLLPSPSVRHETKNGVTFTVLSDGRIGVVGNATANTTFVFCSFSPGERTLIPAGTYTVSGSPGATAYLSFFIYASQETEEIFMSNASLANGKTWTFTLENDAYYGAYLYIGSGKAPNEIVSPQLELGSVATAFEVYSGGGVSPRPDWPQSLNSVGDSGSIDVWLTRTNLLRDVNFPATSSARGITCDYEGDGVFHIYGTYEDVSAGEPSIQVSTTDLNIPFDPDSKYTLCVRLISGQPYEDFHSYLGAGSDTVTVKNWLAANIDRDSVIGQIYSNTASGRSAIKDANKIKRFWIYSYNKDRTAYTADFRIQVWLVKGDIPTEFEPYSEHIVTVSTLNYLRGIPVASDGNYTDSNSQQWICDEIDFERGVYIKRVNTRVFTGAETYGDYIASNGAIATPLWHKPNTKFLCTHAVQWREMSWANDEYISFKVDGFNVSSIDELTERLIAWNEAGDPLTVMYAMRQPEETPLTAEELAAYKEAKTNYPNTMMFNNILASTQLTYNADTKIYVDNGIKQSVTDVLEAIENGSY